MTNLLDVAAPFSPINVLSDTEGSLGTLDPVTADNVGDTAPGGTFQGTIQAAVTEGPFPEGGGV